MRARRFAPAACAAVALCLIPGRAGADAARAWAVARDHLPAQTALVIGADLTAITKSRTFGQLLPLALSREPDARKLFETIRTSCKIDPLAAIHGAVYATDAERRHGALYLSLGGGLDPAKLTRCFEDVAKASGAAATLTVQTAGAITEVTTGKGTAYLSWIGSDVLVIPSDLRDRAMLEKWIGGKGGLAKSPLAKIHGSANTRGALWAASAIGKDLDPGLRMKSAHGALTMAGGNLVLDLRTTLDSAKAATAAVAKATTQIAQVAASGQVSPGVKAMLEQVSVKASGPEVSIKATVPEGELLGLLSMLGP